MTPNDRRSGTLALTPLTPLHTGSGEEYTPMDYVVRGKEFLVKDVLGYFDSMRDNPEAASHAVADGLPLNEEFIRFRMPFYGENRNLATERPVRAQPAQKQAQTAAPPRKMTPEQARMEKIKRQARQGVPAAPAMVAAPPAAMDGNPVRAFARDPFGAPYLPGSGVKGCLRTAVAFLLAPEGSRALDNSLNSPHPPRKEWAFGDMGKRIFGTEVIKDVFKALIVRDSQPVTGPQAMAMSHIKVMNTLGNGFREKPLPLYAECLMPVAGTIDVPFYVDLHRLATDTALEKAAGGKTAELLRDPVKFEASLRAFSQALLELEAKFYNERKVSDKERQFREWLEDGGIYLDLGFGTGWNAKTVGLAMSDDQYYRSRDLFRLGREGMPFPKTRKWAATPDRGYQPMGWVRLDIHWE